MPTKKVNETEILADIVRALRDENTTVLVQTVDGDHIPLPYGKIRLGIHSLNNDHATSIKINDDIQIQKKGGSFIIHTPHGEMNMQYDPRDDMSVLWGAALGIYDSQNNGDQDTFSQAKLAMSNLTNPELRKIMESPIKPLDTRSKQEKAKEKMKALGVTKTQNMDEHIANKEQEAEIMPDIVRALRDENTTVQVLTINGDQIPTPEGKIRHRGLSANNADATSIKINDDIKIQRKGTWFIINTPHGEMKVPFGYQEDMFLLWTAALMIYDSQNNGDKDTFSSAQYPLKNLKNPELRKIAESPIKPLDTRSKYEKGKEKMAKLGIEKTQNLRAHVAKKQNTQIDDGLDARILAKMQNDLSK